jgi:hypothetical protein
MQWLKTIASEIYGLFVDDRGFALAILVWLVAAWVVTPRIPPGWQGVLLAGGLAGILAESVIRAATRYRR